MNTTERMSIAQWKERKKSKYRACPTLIDGQRFASKAEAAYYQELKALQASGAVAWFVRQVPFDLEGGVKYRADFLIVWNDMLLNGGQFTKAKVTVVDVKGFMTPMSRLKIRQVEARYGIEINIIGKKAKKGRK